MRLNPASQCLLGSSVALGTAAEHCTGQLCCRMCPGFLDFPIGQEEGEAGKGSAFNASTHTPSQGRAHLEPVSRTFSPPTSPPACLAIF